MTKQDDNVWMWLVITLGFLVAVIAFWRALLN